MAIYFGSDPGNVVYNINTDISYTISYNIAGSNLSNFWFIFSSDTTDPGNGILVGPNLSNAIWDSGNNHAVLNPSNPNIIQTSFFYPSYKTYNRRYDGVIDFSYNPSADIRTVVIYGAPSNYLYTVELHRQFLALSGSASWGIVGEFTNWGGNPDIPLTETRISGIYTVPVYYNPTYPNSRKFKFRINSTWVPNTLNYGTIINYDPLTSPRQFSLQIAGSDMWYDNLTSTQYVNITLNLLNQTCYVSDPISIIRPYIEFTQPVVVRRTAQLPVTSQFMMSSLFSDNSIVCYKPNSLPSCGVGSVRNSRQKGKKT